MQSGADGTEKRGISSLDCVHAVTTECGLADSMTRESLTRRRAIHGVCQQLWRLNNAARDAVLLKVRGNTKGTYYGQYGEARARSSSCGELKLQVPYFEEVRCGVRCKSSNGLEYFGQAAG